MRNQIFISYSHADSDYQLRLRKHLSTFERAGNVHYWSDTQLKTGDSWKNEIENNIQKTAVAILLISADFLDSDFIRSNELPPLLKAWKNNGVRILPVIVKPCNFLHVRELSQFQAINTPDRTIEEMSSAEQERIWANLSHQAYEYLQKYQEEHNDPEDMSIETSVTVDPADFNDCAISPNQSSKYSSMPDYRKDIENEYIKNSSCPNYMEQEDSLVYYFMQNLFEDPSRLQSFYVYKYEHIDILDFLPKAKDFIGRYEGYNTLIYEVKQLFYQNGWEGDGTIRLMWFPPFLKIGIEDTWGTLAWFVKQSNNGTAFIAAPVPIPYLQEDTNILYPDANGYYTTQIAEVRTRISPNYRCFKIRGLLNLDCNYVANESHWLLYPAGTYEDPAANDFVRFRVKKICELRDFPDVKNTRNIYLHSLEIISR